MSNYQKTIVIIYVNLLLAALLSIQALAQSGQINIPRITAMPNLPAPYIMRDWKSVAVLYDELIFSTSMSGEFLPLIHLKPNGINYPTLQPILLDTYVGSSGGGSQAEAINIIPALVGATLNGVDKSSQNGVDWVMKSMDFFNKANGENVYLNGYSTSSGADWWYDLMPNVFFYQLYSQYPNVPEFETQFTTVADRWIDAVHAMGGSTTPWKIPNMNHRAWKLAAMTPNSNGVIEPESAGTLAWLLYHAWLRTGDKKYLTGAQQSMDFLLGLSANPSYELQLPYGAFIAAKMNAELGTHYNIEKLVNWCFDRGPLRGWGAITGNWNGSDVSGLIGEANDTGNDYAFAMNGFQQAAALVPIAKYDKRFARDIAKWTLNMANASRLFYGQYLPQPSQDDYTWYAQYDPQSVIAYEALKENLDGKKLYGTGDAKKNGWAQTNLGIYGSSHVGYLAAIVETTDVQGILKLDLNKTDFFGDNSFPSFLVYNPHDAARQITLSLGAQSYDIYDAISETMIKSGVTGTTTLEAIANEVMMLIYLPADATVQEKQGKLYFNDKIVDHNFGYHFEGKVRIKSLAAVDTLVEFNQPVVIYSAIENVTGAVTCNWYVNGSLIESSSNADFTWTAPEVAGDFKMLLEIISGSSSATDSLLFRVVENIPRPPVISGFVMDSTWYYTGATAAVICLASDEEGYPLQYHWSLPGGTLISQSDSLIEWNVLQQEGLFPVYCEVTNKEGLKFTSHVNVLIKKPSISVTPPFAWYPLDGNVLDHSGNRRDATLEGAVPATDPRGEPDKAYRFSSPSDIIFVANETSLNFQDVITLSFWIKLDAVTQESFILSHGSWEERWKVSVTPDKKLRWTVKTSSGTKDLDSSFPLALDHYYHFAVLYSGYSMELYADGVLNAFLPSSGGMAITDKPLTFGRKDDVTTNYFLRGTLDEVRIYNEALAPDEIETLRFLWNTTTDVRDDIGEEIILYPNPSHGIIHVTGNANIKRVEVWDITGKKLWSSGYRNGPVYQIQIGPAPGIVILKIETTETVHFRKVRVH